MGLILRAELEGLEFVEALTDQDSTLQQAG